MIRGHGNLTAPVMLIADGATDDDVASGYAISGSNKRMIEGFLRTHRLDPQSLYYTALIKERINLSDVWENVPLVTDQYKNILVEEIKTVNPNVIVSLSELGFHFLSGLKGIRKFRGSVLPCRPDIGNKPIRLIPILGPNPYLSEDQKNIFLSRLDFGKVAKWQNATGPIKDIGFTWIARNGVQLRDYFNRQYEKAKFVVFDIETYCGIPSCISFCFDGLESVTAPILDKSISLSERLIMVHAIADLLSRDIPKVNQNIKFDWTHLEKYCFKVAKVSGDTMLAASLLYCEFPKNLGFLTSIYTDMPYFKDEGKEFDPEVHDRSRLYMYCAKDSLATHQIYTKQLEELEELGVKSIYDNLIRIMPIYKRMDDRGILTDNEQGLKLLGKYITLYEIHMLKLSKLVGYPVNPNSGKECEHLVYEELGYKKIRGVKTKKSGKPSTDEESLELLRWTGVSSHNDANLILKVIIDCRKIHKVIELLETEVDVDKRFRCCFNLAGAETGRTTASASTFGKLVVDGKHIKFKKVGHSFQTIGKHGFEVDGETLGQDIRSLFVPTPGYCFVECDLSQAEARVDAVLARDYDILPIFDGPVGIHRLTGSWVWDCPPEEIKKGVLVSGIDRYHMAKTIRHAGERNMKPDRLMMMVRRPIKECELVLKKFHAKQTNIKGVFHNDIYEQIKKHRVLVAPNRRRRDFFGRIDYDTTNEGISFLPQAIVTDYMKNSLGPTFETLDYALPLSEAHDGFLAELPLGKEFEYARIFKRNVEQPIDFKTCSLSRDFRLTIPCEAEVSYTNWQEMKTLKET